MKFTLANYICYKRDESVEKSSPPVCCIEVLCKGKKKQEVS